MLTNSRNYLFKSEELLSILSGIAMNKGNSTHIIEKIEIDSRRVKPNTLFFALPGERVDGHSFIPQVIENGATAIVIKDSELLRFQYMAKHSDVLFIAVPDTLKALQSLASYWVQKHQSVNKVAITGSCGKTTTKEMLSNILENLGKTAKNPGNFNSEIGLPLSVFSISSATEFGVFEMGINHFGEMDQIVSVYNPDISLITNIGNAHIGFFGSQEAIAYEKSKIFTENVKRGYWGSDSNWKKYVENLRNIELRDVRKNADEQLIISHVLDRGLHGWDFLYEGEKIHIDHIGFHNLQNAIAAIKIAKDFGASPSQIRNGLEGTPVLPGRSRIINGDVTIIEDSYNANSYSVSSIIDYMKALDWKGRKTVVLGSMKELGAASQKAHRELGVKLLSMNPSAAFLYGDEMESTYKVIKESGNGDKIFYTKDFKELEENVVNYARKGDLFLLKGSRVMAMERLLPQLHLVS